jgi:hypothetical protein
VEALISAGREDDGSQLICIPSGGTTCVLSSVSTRGTVFVLFRAITYSSLFIGILLVFLPAQVLGRSGLVRPATFGSAQVMGSGRSNSSGPA